MFVAEKTQSGAGAAIPDRRTADIEERIDQIECELALVAPLVHERARLMRARAAMLGDPSPAAAAPAGRPAVTREDVFAFLIRSPGSRAGEIAAGLGASRPVVAAHLQREKGRLFSTLAGRWYPIPSADPEGRHVADAEPQPS